MWWRQRRRRDEATITDLRDEQAKQRQQLDAMLQICAAVGVNVESAAADAVAGVPAA